MSVYIAKRGLMRNFDTQVQKKKSSFKIFNCLLIFYRYEVFLVLPIVMASNVDKLPILMVNTLN